MYIQLEQVLHIVSNEYRGGQHRQGPVTTSQLSLCAAAAQAAAGQAAARQQPPPGCADAPQKLLMLLPPLLLHSNSRYVASSFSMFSSTSSGKRVGSCSCNTD